MRKVAGGLLVAASVALSLPANAQGVYLGAGPGGGVGAGPDYHDGPRYNGPYRERSRRIYADEGYA
jgi:hypothetical protein